MRFILLFAIAALVTLSSCSTSRYGCPGANSEGRVPGKFKA